MPWETRANVQKEAKKYWLDPLLHEEPVSASRGAVNELVTAT